MMRNLSSFFTFLGSVKCLFSPGSALGFCLLSMALSKLIMLHLGEVDFMFLVWCLRFTELLGFIGLKFSFNLENFQPLFLQTFWSLSLFPFQGFQLHVYEVT